MTEEKKLDRLTVLVARADIDTIKHMAIDRRVSTSAIVRVAMKDFLKAQSPARESPIFRNHRLAEGERARPVPAKENQRGARGTLADG